MITNFASISQTLNTFGGIMAVATLVILAFVYLYSTAKKGRQDIIRQDNADLRASNQEFRTQKAGDEATINEQREAIHHLRDIATQTPAVTKLIEMNTKQQRETNQQHSQVITELSKLTGQISQLAGQFSELAKAINAANNKGTFSSPPEEKK